MTNWEVLQFSNFPGAAQDILKNPWVCIDQGPLLKRHIRTLPRLLPLDVPILEHSRSTYEYCRLSPQHFPNANYHLFLKCSSVAHSGLGVFADETIPRDKVVLFYIGKYRYQNNKPIHPLFIENAWMLTDGTVIDAEEDNFSFGVAKYVNTNERDLLNLRADEHPCLDHNMGVRYISKRRIRKGEELFISYGVDFPFVVQK
ncbi:hypothetical protein GEMRC1_008610 [Eukaryota sp. GEM-RC1]